MKKAELGSFNLNADKNKKQIVENDKMIEKKEAFEHYLNQNDLFERFLDKIGGVNVLGFGN